MEPEGEVPVNIIKGTCQTMCPVSEMKLREREGLLHRFEILRNQPGKPRRPPADPQRIIKAFSRPAAGRVQPSPADIRPGPVLLRTVVYLFENVAPIAERDWCHVYDYVFDRLRAVRQDAVLQGLDGPHLITILEHIVRFHVYAGYRMCEAPVNQFDPVINDQHLLECLKQLIRLYDATPGSHNNQPVFEAVYLLHNLGSNQSIQQGLAVPHHIRESATVKDALDLNLAFQQGNFVRFFRRSMQTSSVLCLCAIHRHFCHARLHAVRVMSMAYSSKTCQFPVSKLVKLLYIDRGHLTELLTACGLLTDQEKISAQHVNFLKAKFTAPEKVAVYKQPELEAQLQKQDLASLLLNKLQDAS
ncbi:SAC3 domain-containing protein 1-like isoform X1 [Littorina saxatilis]|uniref:SAC3/GANP/THP3 conserved domain-containing protein n=1 Tax=Littorina saxatilis TaxID=31220 RepID=A0AAN9G5T9_9CAEN